jgi:hypothetical protein
MAEDFAITDPVSLQLSDNVTLTGAVHRAGIYSGRWSARIVGGTGGLSEILDPQSYRVAPLQLVLDDLMTATGETLSSDSVSLLDHFVAHWHRIQGPASHTLHALSDETGHTWRIDRDGTVWLGTDTWPELSGFEYDLTCHEQRRGVYTIAPRSEPLATPAITFDGQQITTVVTKLGDGSLRQDLHYDA